MQRSVVWSDINPNWFSLGMTICICIYNVPVFEHINIFRLEKYSWTNNNQFGFKFGHSPTCVFMH